MIRLFAGIALPPEIGGPLAGRQTGLEGARWRTLEQMHITLRFFGEVREDVADDLDSELDGISARPFELELQGAGAFGEGADVRAVWAGVVENPMLTQLAKACESAARRAGLKAETRVFRPHVTMAYLRRADPVAVAHWIQRNNLLHSPPFEVERFGLYSSHQTREGSWYRLEREYQLSSA